jgi:putative DNA methylase
VTRMIERWFPCAEVTENSDGGWGSGNQERNLFTWFAARPAAQAKAAVICSLLAWPDDDREQARLQDLVRRAMTGRYEAWDELRDEILRANPEGASVLDPFSGRGMIPLEAARLGLPSYGIDYSPVAVLASELLTDFPFRNWDNEPPLPYESPTGQLVGTEPRLLRDTRAVLAEVGRRFERSMAAFYPEVGGSRPWGYLWATTLPCQECGRRFPLVGSYELRKPSTKSATKTRPALDDPGQSYFIDGDLATDTFSVTVHDGTPRRSPTLSNAMSPDGK